MAVDNTNDDASKQLNAPPAKPAVAGVLKVTTALPLAETPPAKSAVVAMPKVTTALSLTAKPSDKPAAPSINPAVFLTTPTAPFWKSTVSSSSPTPPPVWPFLSPSVQVNPTTVIGETAWQTAAAAAPDLKRKITDPNLEIVTIDPFYDLTVIVGTPSPIEKQVAFRVNKGSMRHASDVWRKMLTGPWAENRSPEPEITFPEDSPWAFEQILRIAHWQAESVSSSFNVTEMKALAVLTDKYDLAGLMKMPTESKGWLVAARRLMERHWPSKPDLQDWAFIAYAFQSDDNYQYLISRMAVETQVDVTDAFLYHITDDARRTRVRSNLPDRLLLQVRQRRIQILQEWIKLCNTAINAALQTSENADPASCGKAICRAAKTGILLTGLQAAHLYPVPRSPLDMHRSVCWYWKSLRSIGNEFKKYKPCDGGPSQGGNSHPSSCNFQKCFGDFGLLTEAQAILKKNTHRGIHNLLFSYKFMKDVH